MGGSQPRANLTTVRPGHLRPLFIYFTITGPVHWSPPSPRRIGGSIVRARRRLCNNIRLVAVAIITYARPIRVRAPYTQSAAANVEHGPVERAHRGGRRLIRYTSRRYNNNAASVLIFTAAVVASDRRLLCDRCRGAVVDRRVCPRASGRRRAQRERAFRSRVRLHAGRQYYFTRTKRSDQSVR